MNRLIQSKNPYISFGVHCYNCIHCGLHIHKNGENDLEHYKQCESYQKRAIEFIQYMCSPELFMDLPDNVKIFRKHNRFYCSNDNFNIPILTSGETKEEVMRKMYFKILSTDGIFYGKEHYQIEKGLTK